jgi:hypothetical protein
MGWADAHRGCQIIFTNETDCALVFDSNNISHGFWATDELEPPTRIEPGAHLSWGSESGGVLTGVEFDMYYRLELPGGQFGGYVRFYWDLPQSGDNEFSFEAPSSFDCVRPGLDPSPQTPNVSLVWKLQDSSTTGDGM